MLHTIESFFVQPTDFCATNKHGCSSKSERHSFGCRSHLMAIAAAAWFGRVQLAVYIPWCVTVRWDLLVAGMRVKRAACVRC